MGVYLSECRIEASDPLEQELRMAVSQHMPHDRELCLLMNE